MQNRFSIKRIKNIVIGFAIFIAGCFVMEVVVRLMDAGDPDLIKLAAVPVRERPAVSNYIGELWSMNCHVDSVAKDKSVYYFEIQLQGSKGDTSLHGSLTRIGEGELDWQLKTN
jgi:hypothetical protein